MKIAPISPCQNFPMCQSNDQEREKKKKKNNTWELKYLYKLV